MNAASLHRRGFTLIELLVVIAIIGVLAGLLFPALARAKGSAKRAACMSNQKQLIGTWVLYASDNKDVLPANGRQSPVTTARKLWVQGAFVNTPDNTNSAYLLSPNFAQFASYLPKTDIYVCPADRHDVNVLGQPYPKIRSYEMNAYVGWSGPWDYRLRSGYHVFGYLSDMSASRMPDGLFVFSDTADPERSHHDDRTGRRRYLFSGGNSRIARS